MKQLNPFFILNNKVFRKTILFDKPKILRILFLSIISTAIFTSFPVITQFYLRYLYRGGSLDELIISTFFFTLLYIFKLIIDIKVEKYEIKYFLKVEKNIKEQIIKKYSKNIKKFLNNKKDLFTKDIGLFILLVRTLYRNILDLTKIFIIALIIFFFDSNLFFYFVLAIPFFFVFYFLIKKNMLEKNNKKIPFESDFGLLLSKLSNKKEDKIIKLGIKNINLDLDKKVASRTSHIKTNQTIKSFINFYRLFYLAYFGVLIITSYYSIINLIVGLLFLTILIRATTNLLQSIPFYTICSKSFFRINTLMKEGNK